jgi:hypothetical protein
VVSFSFEGGGPSDWDPVDYISVDFDYGTERFEEGGGENMGGIVILGI